MSTKTKTIFDHIAGISHKKDSWQSLTEADQKSFTPYIINRWLSMQYDLIEVVDMLQRYTIGQLDTKHTYQLYLDILPKKQYYTKYIKGKKEAKYDKELVSILANHFQVSSDEVIDYIEIWLTSNPEPMYDILRRYGKTDKEIKKWLA
jgi:hypothetical protein